jgi:hypothetical protein
MSSAAGLWALPLCDGKYSAYSDIRQPQMIAQPSTFSDNNLLLVTKVLTRRRIKPSTVYSKTY